MFHVAGGFVNWDYIAGERPLLSLFEFSSVVCLNDFSLIEHISKIIRLHLRHVVSDDDCSLALTPSSNGVYHHHLTCIVQGTGGFVENQDWGVS